MAEYNQYLITVMAQDRVGIIFDVSESIKTLHGNIVEIRQQILMEYFTMTLSAGFPTSVTEEHIQQAILSQWPNNEAPPEISIIAVTISPHQNRSITPQKTYVLTVQGEDKIGFVALVTGFCKDNNINIVDLSTTAVDGSYIMILLVDLSHCSDIILVREKLAAFNRQHGLNLMLQHEHIFKATNEIQMT